MANEAEAGAGGAGMDEDLRDFLSAFRTTMDQLNDGHQLQVFLTPVQPLFAHVAGSVDAPDSQTEEDLKNVKKQLDKMGDCVKLFSDAVDRLEISFNTLGEYAERGDRNQAQDPLRQRILEATPTIPSLIDNVRLNITRERLLVGLCSALLDTTVPTTSLLDEDCGNWVSQRKQDLSGAIFHTIAILAYLADAHARNYVDHGLKLLNETEAALNT